MRSNIRVFVSSTSEDLKDFRAAARDVILGLGWAPLMMEYFGASSDSIIESCRNHLRDADVMLLLIAHRRGWVPSRRQGGNSRKSIVEIELEQARDLGIPIILLLSDRDWPGQLWEDDDSNRKIVRRLRENIDLPAMFFSYERMQMGGGEILPQFQAKVRQELLRFQVIKISETSGVKGLSAVDALVSKGGGSFRERGNFTARSTFPSIGAAFIVFALLGPYFTPSRSEDPAMRLSPIVPSASFKDEDHHLTDCIREFNASDPGRRSKMLLKCVCTERLRNYFVSEDVHEQLVGKCEKDLQGKTVLAAR